MNIFIGIFFLRIYRRKKGDQTTMNAASAPADPLHGVHRNRGMWSFRAENILGMYLDVFLYFGR